MNDKLEAAKLLHLNKDDSYPLALGKLILDWMPWNLKSLILVEEDNDRESNDPVPTRVFTREDAMLYLGSILSSIIPYEDITQGLSDIKYDVSAEVQTAYEAVCIESIFETVKNARVKLIGEADTPEEVEVVSKSLSDMLAKDEVPNILNTIASVIATELKKSKTQLEKIEDSDNKVIDAGTSDPDKDKVPFNPGFEAGANGLDFTGEEPEEPETTDNGDGDTTLPTTEVNADISGEEGEIYSEAFRQANNDALSGNLVYFVKRAISLNTYQALKNNPELAEDPTYQARIILSTGGILTLGYALIYLGIMTKDAYAKKVAIHLVPEDKMEQAGEMNEAVDNAFGWE